MTIGNQYSTICAGFVGKDWWVVQKPQDWNPADDGFNVSLNHDYGQHDKPGGKATKAKPQNVLFNAEAEKPAESAKPAPAKGGQSSLGQGAAGFWEYEARRKAGGETKEEGVRKELSSNILDELKISWGGKGRSLLDGPKYGNWGGKKHSGGNNGNRAPIDSSDRIYKQHDMGWDECDAQPDAKGKMCREQEDAKLVKRLRGLSEDANEWPYPPPRSLRNDAEKYRDGAIYWFKK